MHRSCGWDKTRKQEKNGHIKSNAQKWFLFDTNKFDKKELNWWQIECIFIQFIVNLWPKRLSNSFFIEFGNIIWKGSFFFICKKNLHARTYKCFLIDENLITRLVCSSSFPAIKCDWTIIYFLLSAIFFVEKKKPNVFFLFYLFFGSSVSLK